MNVVVDYGNSSAKVGIFDQHTLVRKEVFARKEDLLHFIQNFSAQNFIISSVNVDSKQVLEATPIRSKFELTPQLPLPIKNLYKTPATLGADRIAGVCGAHQLFPNQPCLVIDAGTCITYDFIDEEGNFRGGGISPGLSMRFQAMHSFTAKLPLVSPTDDPELIGNTTETCMQSGVVLGIVGELDSIISRYQEEFDGLKVILSGGDTRFFENKLKASIFAGPELVLSGLNSILLYNVSR
jgi:type III pantothenate kinase